MAIWNLANNRMIESRHHCDLFRDGIEMLHEMLYNQAYNHALLHADNADTYMESQINTTGQNVRLWREKYVNRMLDLFKDDGGLDGMPESERTLILGIQAKLAE